MRYRNKKINSKRKVSKIFTISVLIIFLFIFFSYSVEAYQEKMTMKECYYSFAKTDNYEDVDWSQYWDENTQKGIFLKVENKNLDLGENEDPEYKYTTYQEEREYYTPLETTSEISTIPILQVDEGNNYVFINCTYKVGDFRVFPLDLRATHGSVRMSHDFNLLKEVVTNTIPTDYSHNRIESDYDESIHSRQSTPILRSQRDRIRYINNEVDEDASWTDGFYPNTEPKIITRMSVKDFPTGLYEAISLIRENDHNRLISPGWKTYFYINSTTKDTIDYLTPRAINWQFTNEETGDTFSRGDSGSYFFIVEHGDNITVDFSFKNEFDFPLDNIKITTSLNSINQGRGGIMRSGTDLTRWKHTELFEDLNFDAFEEKTLTFSKPLPEGGYAFPDLRGEYRIFSEYAQASVAWPRFGSDSVNYLGFDNFDPRISFVSDYGAVFDIDVNLQVINNLAYEPEIHPGEYDILVEIYKDNFANLVGEELIKFNQEEFDKIGENKLTAGTYDYNIKIPIREEWKQNPGRYYVRPYSIKRTEPFKNLRIATLSASPYFEAGGLIPFEGDNIFYFWEDSRIYSKDITIFNPIHNDAVIDLSVENLGDDFDIDYPDEVELRGYEDKEIEITVNATHDSWPGQEIQSSFTLEASMVEGDDDEEVSDDIQTFHIEVYPEPNDWLNIEARDIEMESEFNPGDDVDMELLWRVQGSESGFKNDDRIGNYDVNVTLMKDGDVYGYKDKEFFIPEEGSSPIDEIWDVEFSIGDSVDDIGEYEVMLEIDVNDDIDEVLPEGGEGIQATADNEDIHEFNVFGCMVGDGYILTGSCYYNSSNKYLYYCSGWSLEEEDDCDSCGDECPDELLCSGGECMKEGNEGECETQDTLSQCIEKEPICAWNETDSECLACSLFRNPTSCTNYDNEDTCEADPCYLASGSNDDCVWINGGGSGECKVGETFSGNGDDDDYTCVYDDSWEDKCDTQGVYIVSYELDDGASDDQDNNCEGREDRQISCMERRLMPFHNSLSIIISLLFVAIFYILFFRIGDK